MTGFVSYKTVLAALALTVFAASAFADVPSTMNYQGCLTDIEGNPVADMPHNITFRIYDDSGTVRWEEPHTITTADGLLSVELGSNGSPLTVDVFDHAECWLGITVDGAPEISPRTRLNTVPYSFRTGRVQAGDIVNESGVAAYSGAFYVYLEDLDYTVLGSATIECPDSGYVMAVAHGRVATLPEHTFGTHSYATVGISDVPDALPGNQDLDFHIDSAAPSGTYAFPFGMTSMFEVPSAGSYTYYYLAYEYSGSVTVADMQLNLVYFPTAYGTVDPVPPPVKLSDGANSLKLDGQIQTANTETAKSAVTDIAQLERELAVMKARIEAIQRQVDSIGNE